MSAETTGDGHLRVDTITDQTGDSITVSVVGDMVCLRVNEDDDEAPMVWLNAEQRDQFVKAFVVATYRAETSAEHAAAGAQAANGTEAEG